jgi:hypothetical protein
MNRRVGQGRRLLAGAAIALAMALLAAGCQYQDPNQEYIEDGRQRDNPQYGTSVLGGDGGVNLFGGSSEETSAGGAVGIGVNSYLWRASLDTISFMPLASADPFGGVIITDWYAPPETPDERFKMTVYILDRTLRADGVKVALFRQLQNSGGGWVDSPIDPATVTSLENRILERARQMRKGAAGP